MPETNYTAHVTDMFCARDALTIVIERLWDDEKSGEAFLLERVREVMGKGASAMDELIYSCNKQNA